MKSWLPATACALVLAVSVLHAESHGSPKAGPPPPPPEVIPAVPATHPTWVWRGGYYRWHEGRYVWVPGAYARPPHAGYRWYVGRWRQTRDGWVWVAGHWR